MGLLYSMDLARCRTLMGILTRQAVTCCRGGYAPHKGREYMMLHSADTVGTTCTRCGARSIHRPSRRYLLHSREELCGN